MKPIILVWAVVSLGLTVSAQAADQAAAKRAAKVNSVTALQNTPIPSDYGASANVVVAPPSPSQPTTIGQQGGSTTAGNGGTVQLGTVQGTTGGSSSAGNGGTTTAGTTTGQSGGSSGGGTGGNTPASVN